MSSRPPTAIPCDPTPPSLQTHPDFQQEFHEDGTITMADGKIRKRMVKKADINAECPPPQAEVTVHYIGTFDDGRTFDNSRVRNAPFTFRLGGQAVIRGWEIAIRSMKLGEVAKFWIASELAYGSEGRLPEVPPNTPLNFEIELINWTMRQKVTEDGGVYKTIINAGTGPNRPNDFAVTRIRYQGKNKDGKVFDEEHWTTPFTYTVSSHTSPPPGFDDAIKNMYAGEHSIFTLRPDYAWGEKGCAEKNVGVNEQVIYEIVLEEFTKGRESWEMSLEEKVERMLILKDQGNSYFKQGDLGRAFAHYEKSVKWIQYDAHLTSEEKSRVDAIKVINYQNMAIVRSKEKKWDEVIKHCSEGLKLDAKHVKCLFLRGKAYTALHDSERALADLKIAAELAPDSAEITAAQRGVEADIARTRKKEQSMWGGLFSRHHVKLIDDTEPDVQRANKLKEREKQKQEIEKKKKEDDNWESDEEDLEAADETPEQARKREEEAIAIAREEAAADAMQQG